jgi:hypothetical protein
MTQCRGSTIKALLVFELVDDAQPEAGRMIKELPHALHEVLELPGVTAVSKDHEQANEAMAELALEQLRAIAVLHS